MFNEVQGGQWLVGKRFSHLLLTSLLAKFVVTLILKLINILRTLGIVPLAHETELDCVNYNSYHFICAVIVWQAQVCIFKCLDYILVSALLVSFHMLLPLN